MGRLRRRLEALEGRAEDSRRGPRKVFVPRSLERLFHEHDSARRVQAGFGPLPELPYTEEDYEDDLTTLREHAPAMRAEPSWQTEEGRAFLDEWERETRERVERKYA